MASAKSAGDGDGGQSNLNQLLTSLADYYSGRRDEQPANIFEDKRIFPEFRGGPLDTYRQRASFCYKRLNVLLEGEEHIRLKVTTTNYSWSPRRLGQSTIFFV